MSSSRHAPNEPADAPRFRRALIVANPIAGRGQGRKAAHELERGLRERGISAELYFTEKAGDAFSHLRSLDQGVELVVSVGGDGTLREVLDGLVDPTTPVGVLPFGTANVLSKELGLPRDVHHCIEILARGRVVPVDVANVNGRLSLLMTGVGIDAMVVREVERRRKGPITKWSYVTGALHALSRYAAPTLRVTLDGEALKKPAGFVLISNTINYGGVLSLAPDARMNDRQFEVYLFPTGSLPELAVAFARGALRNLPGGRVELRRAREIRVESETPVPFQVDGDLGGETPVDVRLAPNQYHLVVPRR